MKKENLNIKKQEWVTPEIKNLVLDDNEGKNFHPNELTNSLNPTGTQGPS